MTTWAEVKKHLRNGYKVAIEITEGLSVFAQKTDYIAESERKGVTNGDVYSNYDGEVVSMYIDHDNQVIYHRPHHFFKTHG
jgi:hypothetical protein